MFPYLNIFHLLEVHTNTLMLVLSLILALTIFLFFLKKEMSSWKVIGYLLAGSLFSFICARLFHVFFEKPEFFIKNPDLILTKFDGMTFYGSLIGGVIFIVTVSNVFSWSKLLRAKFWDASVLSSCLTLFLMRIGCFANGCCWGSITAHPWGVQYFDPRSAMPYSGIPVHPVQLYDAFVGLVLFIVLFIWWKERAGRAKLVWMFFCLYPIARFTTEFFRGDSFRGEDILGGLSTSQLISIILFAIGSFGLYWQRQTRSDYLV